MYETHGGGAPETYFCVCEEEGGLTVSMNLINLSHTSLNCLLSLVTQILG